MTTDEAVRTLVDLGFRVEFVMTGEFQARRRAPKHAKTCAVTDRRPEIVMKPKRDATGAIADFVFEMEGDAGPNGFASIALETVAAHDLPSRVMQACFILTAAWNAVHGFDFEPSDAE